MVLEYLPLAAILALGLLTLASPLSTRLDRFATQVALAVFGGYVAARSSVNRTQRRTLENAHVPTTYRVYASRTFLYSTVAALVGSIGGVYVLAGLLSVLSRSGVVERLPAFVASVTPEAGTVAVWQAFVLFVVSSATVGVLAALSTYQLRWAIPRYVAAERERNIDSTIKRNVAFIFALSRSGMAFPAILRTLARNRPVYGETAAEMGVTVRDIDLFGTDLLTAIERLGTRTPSQELAEFAENLSSVLQSGQSLPAFLRGEYEYFKDEEASQQQAFLELVSTLAEAYVTVFVAGPLFLITILVVIGLMLGGTIGFLRAMVYLIIPLSTAGFVIYLDTITDDVRDGDVEETVSPEIGRFSDIRVVADEAKTALPDGGVGATPANRYRLRVYRRYRPIARRLRDPVRLLTERPIALLAVTVPLGLVWTVAGWWPHLAAGSTAIAAYDDSLIQSALFVIGTFAITYEISHRRRKAIEAAIPDFLDRLASTNEAGMSIVDSIGRVVRSDLGTLSQELERTWADIVWGAHVENAFVRFRRRVETPAVTRVVTLTTNAMAATNDIGPVLRIAADEAQAARRLDRERRNEMLTYTVVVYLSFFVFLVIVIALDLIFVPAIPTGQMAAGAGAAGATGTGLGAGIQQLTMAEKNAYSLLFFHAALIQAVASGFVAGQMGEGTVKAGAKHATIMLIIAYGLFLVFG